MSFLNLTRKGGSSIRVFVDDVETSVHNEEKEAIEFAVNQKIANPNAVVTVQQDSTILVEIDETVLAPTPDPDPDPTPDPDPDPDPNPDPTPNPDPDPTPDPTPGDVTTYAYVATWDYNVGGHGNWGTLRRDELDWDAFDVGILFASGVGSDGTINEPIAWNNVSPDRINTFVADAQAAGKKTIMSLGGAGNSEGLFAAIANNPETFADNCIAFCDAWGFDGIDIDAEPTGQVDGPGLLTFAQRFKTQRPDLMLIAAINGGFDQMAGASDYFDHINYMTYDLSGAWPGWYSWHNAAIFDPNGATGTNIPGSNTEYPNVASILDEMVAAGIPEEKCGFGISVDGYAWTGVTAPEQDAAGATRTWAPQDISVLVSNYNITEWLWDDNAKASYASPDADTFISVDNARGIAAKYDYARQRGITSIIYWKYSEYPEVVNEMKKQNQNNV